MSYEGCVVALHVSSGGDRPVSDVRYLADLIGTNLGRQGFEFPQLPMTLQHRNSSFICI